MKRFARRKWTDEEIEYLQEKMGVVSIPYIAKKLNRSVNAIIIKAKRMKLGCFKNSTDLITVTDVIQILDVNPKTVYQMIYDKKLKYSKKKISEKSTQYFFDYDYITEFAKEYNKQNNVKWSDVDVERLKMYKNLGFTTREIAKKLNRSEIAIQHKYKRTTEETK